MKAELYDKAIEKFEQFILSIDDRERTKSKYLRIFGTYLSIFSKMGDIDGMKKAVKFIRRNGHELDIVMYGELMRGCIVAKKPNKALKYYSKMTENGINRDITIVSLKCAALEQLIKLQNNFEQKLKMYNLLIAHNKEYFRLLPASMAAESQLRGCIALYHDVDPMKIVELFEEFVSKNILQYKLNANQIDVHSLHHIHVQFLLRYIIGCKLHEFDLDHADGLSIIVGKDRYSKIAGIEYKYNIKQFVRDELLTFEPSIKCKVDSSNAGRLIIPKTDLLPYIDNIDNCARNKLTNVSNDWYLQ